MNISEYAWMCLNKQNSEYASALKHTKLPNMAGLSICERYKAFRICQNMPWQSSEYILGFRYARIEDSEYGRVLNMQELHRVLDMSQYGCVRVNRTWICLNMSEFKIIDRVLNMYHTMHGARSLYMPMCTYWETCVFRTRSKI